MRSLVLLVFGVALPEIVVHGTALGSPDDIISTPPTPVRSPYRDPSPTPLTIDPYTLRANLVRYPGYQGNPPGGQVTVVQQVEGRSPQDLNVSFTLNSLPMSSSGKIHIHRGVSCEDALLVGEFLKDGPTRLWIADAMGNANGNYAANLGQTMAQIELNAVVVHDPDNEPAACGLLSGRGQAAIADFTLAGTTAGGVEGKVVATAIGSTGLTLHHALSKLGRGKQYRLVVTEGTCESPGAQLGSAVAWQDSIIATMPNTVALGRYDVDVGLPLSMYGVHNKPVLLTGSNGKPISCAMLFNPAFLSGGERTIFKPMLVVALTAAVVTAFSLS